jgi:hypothetical protein
MTVENLQDNWRDLEIIRFQCQSYKESVRIISDQKKLVKWVLADKYKQEQKGKRK